MKLIAILSDTHGLLRPEVLTHLTDVDHIFHAGDVGSKAILQKLQTYAPLTAVQGNTDLSFLGLSYSELVDFAGLSFFVQHIEEDIMIAPKETGVDVVITGHTHLADIRRKEGVLFLNPGSAGRQRGSIPPTMMLLQILDDGSLEPKMIRLVG